MSGNLTEKDHRQMDKFLGEVFDAIQSKQITRGSFIDGMAQVMAALDIDNHGEALAWFKNGPGQFRLDHSGLDSGARLS